MKEKEFDKMFAQKLLDAGYKFVARDKSGLYAYTDDGWRWENGYWIIDSVPQKIWPIPIECFNSITESEKHMTKLSDIFSNM